MPAVTLRCVCPAGMGPGDTIEVEAGDYPETLVVDVDVSIVGLGGLQNTSLSGTGAPAVTIDGANVTLTGFTIQPTADRGIRISNGANFTGTDLDISGFTGVGAEEGLAVWGPLTADQKAAAQLIDSRAVFTRITVSNNISGADGAIATDNANLFIDDSTFQGNQALDDGGALDIDNDSEVQISQTSFVANTSVNSGGAINAQGGGMVAIEGCTFDSNIAQGDGGAVRIRLLTTGELRDNSFTTNTAGGHGGAFDLADGVSSLTDNLFVGNDAVSGGAIYAYQTGELYIDGDVFEGNVATQGGAISARDDIISDIQVATFISNEATVDDGGAIQGNQVLGAMNIAYSTFMYNLATDDGGAVFVESANGNGSLVIDTNHFVANAAEDDGGALALDAVQDVSITANIFCLNDGGEDGGAATVVDSGVGSSVWSGNAIVDNLSSNEGGAILLDGGGPTDLTNNTFAGNSGPDGGHLRVEQTTVNLVNNIFTTALDGDGLSQDSTDGVRDYNLWFSNTPNDIGDQLDTNDLGSNSVFADPDFTGYTADNDCFNDDLTLNPGSPAIDAGDPSILDRDGSISDIGAHGGLMALPEDADGDGFTAQQDCNDNDPAINPDAEEVCDGVDNNCNGRTDGEDATGAVAWYYDGDSDGFGEDLTERFACYNPGPFVNIAGDCDDTDPNVSPSGVEVCDGVDQNCDGSIDEGVLLPWYTDSDGDGYGDDNLVTDACSPTDTEVAAGGDCDDTDPAVNPGAAEVCDDLDNDCDASVDEDLAQIWYADEDGDGVGTDDSATEDCSPIDGYSLVGGDCDDTDPAIQYDCDSVDAEDGGKGKEESGCGCQTGPTPAPAGVLALIALLAARRRRLERP